ncbi:MAG: deoxyribonuclease IV [Planctomycetota bacterium]
MLLGSHLSIAGAMTNALDEAQSLGLDTVQVFTKNQRTWKFKPLEDEPRDAWNARLEELGWGGRAVAHDSYLINLASPDDELWDKSVTLMREEIERCHALGIPHLVSHPGAHMRKEMDPEEAIEAGLQRIADAYKILFEDTADASVVMCFENTAGGGTTLGRTFEELARLAELVHEKAGAQAERRVGFCFDTCHALAAGYDLATHASGDGSGKKRTIADARAVASDVLDEFDSICGLSNLRVLHCNDSKGARGSRIDRHEHIGKGHVSKGAFAAVLNRPELGDVPLILETPKGEDDAGTPYDTLNLRTLRRLMD